MIAKNDEEKRSQIWRIVTTVSTVLIIVIVGFFLIKLFTSNPLEGAWIHEDTGMVMTIKGGGKAVVKWPEEYENTNVKVTLNYSVEKDTKTFTLRADDASIQKAAKASEGVVTAEGLASTVSAIEATYDYSIERSRLTLTDREYGEQLIFDKQ